MDEPIEFSVNVDEAFPQIREATDEALRSLVANEDVLFEQMASGAMAILDGLELDNLPPDALETLVHRISYTLFGWWFVGRTGSAFAEGAGVDAIEFSQLVDETIERWAEEIGYRPED